MTKIHEVYNKYCYDKYGLSSATITFEDRKDDITDVMKEYAEYYAKRTLEIASKNLDYWQDNIIQITKDSVKYLDLPEH
jgi:hypothetical protein